MNTTIDGAGHWLRRGAAASYLRMLAAGMPAGGIASAGRTRAEQAALYEAYRNGTGNLAARPGTSRHETGQALDITRGTDAHTWAVRGGVRLQARRGEHITANLFGWFRTVTSEAWHFQYIASRDPLHNGYPTLRKGNRSHRKAGAIMIVQHAVGATIDGVYGPATMAAVRAWQEAHDLTPDGITGYRTWASIFPPAFITN